MRRTNKSQFQLNQTSSRKYDLNRSLTNCAPCLEEALKIDRQICESLPNEIKINKIRAIVKSIFESSKNVRE